MSESEFGFKISSDSRQAQQDLAKLNASVNKIADTTKTATDTLASLAKQVAVVFGSIAAFTSINKASDALINLENRIALVTGRTRDLVNIQKELVALSFRTRSSTSDATEVFVRFAKALQNQGKSYKDILTATEAVQKSIAISGSSADSASAAIIQLGQGLASGVLRGEELNSVLEQAPRLAQAIADSLKLTVGELRAFAADGKLTAEKVFKALIQQSGKLNDEFKLLNPTFEQATKQLGQSIQRVIGEFAKATGSSSKLSVFILKIADSLNSFSEEVGSIVDSTLFNLEFFYQDTKKIFYGIRGLFEDALSGISIYIKPINLGQFLPSLESIKIKVQAFGAFIKGVFYDIWDAVVGNSYWPDTINGVIEWAKKLLPNIRDQFDRFKIYILDIFQTIKTKVSDFTIKVGLEIANAKDIGLLNYLANIVNELTSRLKVLGSTLAKLPIISNILDFDYSGFSLSIKNAVIAAFSSIKTPDLKPFADVLLLTIGAVFSSKIRNLTFGAIAIKLAVDFQDVIGSENTKKFAYELGQSIGRIIKSAISSEGGDGISGLLKKITAIISEFGQGLLQGVGLTSETKSGGLIAGLLFGTSFTALLTGNLTKLSKFIFDHIIKPLGTSKEKITEVTDAAGNISKITTKDVPFLEKLIFGEKGMASGSSSITETIQTIEKNTIRAFIGTGTTILSAIFGKWISDTIIKTFGIDDTFTQIGITMTTSLVAGFLLTSWATKLTTAIEAAFVSAGLLSSIFGAGGAIAGALAGGFLGEKAADFLGIEDPMTRLFFKVGGIAAGAFIGGFIAIKVGAAISAAILLGMKALALEIGAAVSIAVGGAIAGTAGGVGLLATIKTAFAAVTAAIVTFFSIPAVLAALGITAGLGLLYYIFFGSDEDSVGGKIRDWSKSIWEDLKSGWDSLVQRIKNTKNPFTLTPSDNLLFPQGTPSRDVNPQLRRASGGDIRGPGTGTSDSIMAMLSNGEYVVNAVSTKKYRSLIEAINTDRLPRFVSGGFINAVRENEGYSDRVYTDTQGYLTVGVGHKLTPDEISRFNLKNYIGAADSILRKANIVPYTKEQINSIFNRDVAIAINSAANVVRNFGGNFDQLPDKVRDVIADMSFQLGESGLSRFTSTIPALISGKYQEAIAGLQNSLNFKQTPERVLKRINWIGDAIASATPSYKDLFDPTLATRELQEPSESLFDKLKRRFEEFRGTVSGAPGKDQIPALLSDGEFVVNAEDTKKNFGLLNWINSGLPAFQYGSSRLETPALNQLVDPRNYDLGSLSSSEMRSIERYLKVIAEANKRIEVGGLTKSDLARNTDIANKSYDSLYKILNRVSLLDTNLTKGSYRITAEGLAEGQKLSNALIEETKSGFAAFLKGQQSFSDLRDSLINSFTSKVIDAFSTGFVNSLVESFGFDRIFKDIFGGIFDLGGFFGGKRTGATPAEALWVQIVGALGDSTGTTGGGLLGSLSNFGSSIGQGLSNFGNSIANEFGYFFSDTGGFELLGSLGFAEGGIVPGIKGQAVPITAHAGEIILNEAQQARVAAAMQAGSANQSVVNLSITGDISRQTRSEIMQMLPQITAGVNANNRENNYKGNGTTTRR